MSRSFFWPKFVEIYGQVFNVLKKRPTIWLLFFIIAAFDGLALSALFFSPSPPFSGVLAPIIRRFYGEMFLHYPDNFIVLPKLFQHAHFMILSVFGIFVTGIVYKKFEGEYLRKKVTSIAASGQVFRKYFAMLGAWILMYVAFNLVSRVTGFLLPQSLWIQLAATFVIGLVIQSLFAFILPGVLLMDWGFIKGVWRGLQFGARHLLLTSTLLFIPMILMTFFSFVKLFVPVIVRDMTPEYVLWILVGGIFISLIVDVVVTSSVAVVFLNVNVKKP